MKAQIQIKTGDFEYIMEEVEAATHEDAVRAFNALKKAYYLGGGLPEKEFQAIYDTLLKQKPISGDPGIIGRMSMGQQFALNELKKANKRANYKSNEDHNE